MGNYLLQWKTVALKIVVEAIDSTKNGKKNTWEPHIYIFIYVILEIYIYKYIFLYTVQSLCQRGKKRKQLTFNT